jgi:hypothetical protein
MEQYLTVESYEKEAADDNLLSGAAITGISLIDNS